MVRARIASATPPRAAVLLAALALIASATLFASLVGLATPARAAGECPNVSLTPRAGNAEAIREAVLCLVNREREAHGESPLLVSAKLTRAAQGHSEDMASGDYFSHYAPSGSSPLDRMRASGYIYSSQLGYEVGENIAWGTLWLASPQSIVSSWMASPEHRANILDAGYRETGIGVSPHPPASLSGGQAGGLYTQDFGTVFSAGHTARHPGAHGHTGNGGHPRTLSAERSSGGTHHAHARRGAGSRSFELTRHLGTTKHRRPHRRRAHHRSRRHHGHHHSHRYRHRHRHSRPHRHRAHRHTQRRPRSRA